MQTQSKNNLPIGVFDSGVGGLTVLRELQKRLPNESFLYLGDTARLPYGTKSQETVIQYALQANQLLVNRGIKFLVIACNTATAQALQALQTKFTHIPIVDVINPGAQAACLATRNGHIAVIATEGTVKAQGYQMAIQKIRPDTIVHAQSCSLFVALAEEGWVNGPIAEAVAQHYIEPLFNSHHPNDPDCLVLGCTHFPILIEPIKKIAGTDVAIIDSAIATTDVVQNQLHQLNLLNPQLPSQAYTHFMATDAPERFARVARYFLRAELNSSDIELIDLMQ